MPDIFEWPVTWYHATSSVFSLSSRSQGSESPWTASRSVRGPHAQFWICKMSMNDLVTYRTPKLWEVAAFFSRLDGSKNLIRIGHTARVAPQYNVEQTPGAPEAWSDGTYFTDNTGYVPGVYLPPTVFVAAAGAAGSNAVVIGGLPVSVPNVLRRGDLFEIRIGGVANEVPHLYEIVVGSGSNTSGFAGVEVRPRLRSNISVGDTVVLNYPSSVFRCVDDNQGEIETQAPIIGNLGFTLVEAIV